MSLPDDPMPTEHIPQDGRSAWMDLTRGWRRFDHGEAAVYLPERVRLSEELQRRLRAEMPEKQLHDWANDTASPFAAVVETPDFVFAAVDKIRSIPLFYGLGDKAVVVSNFARTLLDRVGLDEVDETAITELRMAGYVTGRDTVYSGLHQLQAGECLFQEKKSGDVRRERYYRYRPLGETGGDEEALVTELADRTDAIFARVVASAGERPIWVPLSGGLDSRLVLCKLREHGASRLQAFSYGPPGNHEAAAAQEVAGRLDIPWFHISLSRREIRGFFLSDERRAYWEFADGLSAVPSMAEVAVLMRLREDDRLPADAILVNGQSGDFISGNHIPPVLAEPHATVEDVLEAVIHKHYALWTDLQTRPNLALARGRVSEVLQEVADGAERNGPAVASLYELWEWQERQSKSVVNGQRAYEYLGLDWELPLWDDEYLRFWSGVPVDLRVGQSLYRHYLRQYDDHGLFAASPPSFHPRPTPGWRYFPLHGAARAVQLLVGDEAAAVYRRYTRYFGYYGPQYRSYPFRFFLRHAASHRGPVSFFAETWVEENLGLRLRS